MNIIENPLSYYVKRLQTGPRFAFVGYSDAEWYCIIRHRLGLHTGLGQKIDADTGDKLLSVLKRRNDDSDFLVAIPKCLWTMEDCVTLSIGQQIESAVESAGVTGPFFERDVVLDDAARSADLFPLISQLRKMRTAVIGNPALEHLRPIIPFQAFVATTSPNHHLEPGGIEATIESCQGISPDVFLVSAGISAALIIDGLYDKFPRSTFLDCGSIWDAFVGIGCQREWRRLLYSNPEALARWRKDNLNGKQP
jgi:hypothetical protein